MILSGSIRKTVLLLGVAVIAALKTVAAAPSPGVVSSFSSRVASGCVSIEFSYEVSGALPLVSTGTAILQDSRYMISSSDMRIWNDGSTLWLADDPAKELYAEDVHASDGLSNPITLLSGLSAMGKLSGPVSETFDGKRVQGFVVEDLSGLPDLYKEVKFYFQADLPSAIRIVMTDGSVATVRVKSCVFLKERKSDSFFEVDPSARGSYKLTDLRGL